MFESREIVRLGDKSFTELFTSIAVRELDEYLNMLSKMLLGTDCHLRVDLLETCSLCAESSTWSIMHLERWFLPE